MSRDDWFRNGHWDDNIEAAFFAKLAKARRKTQYLRIQACTLAERHPKAALSLLDRYFAMMDRVEPYEKVDLAQAYADQARAHLALEDIDAAIMSYEAALGREAAFPNSRSQAYVELPFLIATRNLQPNYRRALAILNETQSRPMFPIEKFRWNAAQALILDCLGHSDTAQAYASDALAAAALDHSGFRHHPTIGLVRDIDPAILRRLEKLAGPPARPLQSM
jgi:tetratricopeptide (TPR) repeat protein